MDIGKALQGMGAGFSGRGAEWALMQQQEQAAAEKRKQEDILRRQQAMAQDARIGLHHLQNNNLGAFEKLATNRIELIKQQGENPSDTAALLERVKSGDVAGAIGDLQALEFEAVQRGLLPEQKPEYLTNAQVSDTGQAYKMVNGKPVAVDVEGYQAKPKEDKNGDEIRKETRSELRQNLKAISSEVGVIKSNYKKIEELSKEVSKDNRTAVAALMTALVKLGDPGSIVNTSEMENALNSQNPLAYFAEKGINVDAKAFDTVMQKIDPLSPGNIDVNNVKATARALVAANVPDLLSRYDTEYKRGQGNLTEAGFKAIFMDGLDSRVKSLSELLPKDEPPQQGGALPKSTGRVVKWGDIQ
jgi:hypothetical protein